MLKITIASEMSVAKRRVRTSPDPLVAFPGLNVRAAVPAVPFGSEVERAERGLGFKGDLLCLAAGRATGVPVWTLLCFNCRVI